MSTVVDWDSVGQLGFEVAERTARSVARAYAGTEEDDLFQESLLYLATHPEEMRQQYMSGYDLPGVRGGYIGGRKTMIRYLSQRMRRWAMRHLEGQQLELVAARRHVDKLDTSRWSTQSTPAGFAGMPYTPALVEALVPSVWDMSMLASATSDSAPDPTMPRGSSDPSHAGTHMAHYADIRWAWQALNNDQRRVLFLRYGAGWEMAEIGAYLGVHRTTVTREINRAIGDLAGWLNGKRVELNPETDAA